MTTRRSARNKGMNARQAELLNSTFVLLFGLCSKLNIFTFIPAIRQAQIR